MIKLLFDTGATVVHSDSARTVIGNSPEIQGGSFMKNSVIEKWKKGHPNWKVLRKGAKNFDMIEVPVVETAGHQVGPVWFYIPT
ncbi:MAG TPA: hypothetical protein VL728_01960 [Cyclobacteriaceae bacterium]|jgi:hypothetical protein|nr:hypothetical protein [Cyclobacteriaceae bacterium]